MPNKLLLALAMAACATAQKYNVDVRPWPSGLPYTGLVTLHMESDRPSEMYRALCESAGMRLEVRHLEIGNRIVGVDDQWPGRFWLDLTRRTLLDALDEIARTTRTSWRVVRRNQGVVLEVYPN